MGRYLNICKMTNILNEIWHTSTTFGGTLYFRKLSEILRTRKTLIRNLNKIVGFDNES